ncbi:MAG: sugar transferase [Halobacteriovoraceae bacterium]|nr:sugar transferase [Halobacteriovoraceae bacterium]
MKRLFDFTAALIGLIVLSPVLIIAMIAVWLQDYCNPLYIPLRVGKDEKDFKMIKLRSMVMNADKNKVDSTSSNDSRITAVGRTIRKLKLDELSQLWNVLVGDMSLVGPRPNVRRETDLYTAVEKKLLTVKPGITDFSSIVFADEGDILANSKDPDIDFNQLIRPWKSRLGIFYIENRSFLIDLKLIFLTVLLAIDRQKALNAVSAMLEELKAPADLVQVAKRQTQLVPQPPPGATELVTSRNL